MLDLGSGGGADVLTWRFSIPYRRRPGPLSHKSLGIRCPGSFGCSEGFWDAVETNQSRRNRPIIRSCDLRESLGAKAGDPGRASEIEASAVCGKPASGMRVSRDALRP